MCGTKLLIIIPGFAKFNVNSLFADIQCNNFENIVNNSLKYIYFPDENEIPRKLYFDGDRNKGIQRWNIEVSVTFTLYTR